jgi:hypothetical protein
MILGRDCLAKHNAKIDYKRDVLQMDVKEGLFSACDVTIPPNSQQEVSVKLREKQKHLCTGAIVSPCRNGRNAPLLLGEQKIKIRDGQSQVLLTNRGAHPLRLRTGERLGIARSANPYTKDAPMRHDEKSRPARHRTDAEYRDALNRVDFTDSVLDAEQERQIKQVIWQQRSVLSVDDDIGCLKDFQHEIKLKDDTPFNCVPYRLTPAARQVMKNELDHHLDQGAIEPHLSSYNSPCILVKKEPYKHMPISEAKCRLVIDLRTLNQKVVKEKYCIPHVVETVSQLDRRSLQYMTLLDLTKGFNQIQIHPNSYKYVTFRTDGLGSYALKRLPMGYVNSSEIFQMCMERIIPLELRQHITPLKSTRKC